MKTPIRPLLIALTIYCVGVLLLALVVYRIERDQQLREADSKLRLAARAVPQMLATDFHDRALNAHSISAVEDHVNMRELSRHAKIGGFAYLYTYIVVDDEVRFTSSSYDDDDVAQGIVSKYWTDYGEGPLAYWQAWRDEKITYVTNTDRWGTFRTVLIPMRSPSGQRFVAGADYSIDYIEAALWQRAVFVAVLGGLMLLLALPLVFAYRRTATQMNQQLQQLNHALNEDIDHARRVEDELRAVTQAATNANAAKSQFLANMTHELRTPLNGVLGMTELLLNTELNALQREYAEMTQHSGEVLLDTINQILDFAAVESGHLAIRCESTAMLHLVDELSRLFAPMLNQPPLDLLIHLDDTVPPLLWLDHNRVRQILINLIGNALKFTHSGGVEVSLSWRDNVLNGRVMDTGVGIARDQQARIFEAFQQADNSTTRKYGGTGLGLPLARALSRAMQGDLWLERASAAGSVFCFRVHAPMMTPTETDDRKITFTGAVVIISEFAANAAWLTQQFERAGARCLVVADGNEAIASRTQAQLVVVDANVDEKIAATIVDDALHGASPCPVLWLCRLSQKAPEHVIALHKPLTVSALHHALRQLPQPDVYQTPLPAVSVATESVTPALSFSNRKPILVVEDNPVNRVAILHMLTSLGYQGDAVSSGAEALKQLSEQLYRVVLMDVQMAEMDGLETTRRIVRALGTQAPRIIAVSAHVFPDDVRLARDAGMIDFVGKPIRRDELQRVLKLHLE